MSYVIEKIDEYLEKGEKQKAYDELKELYDDGRENDPVILWRLAFALFLLSVDYEKKDPKRKELTLEGRLYAQRAAQCDPTNFKCLQWAAIMTGQSTDFLPTKEKIEQGHIFKELLDKALAIDSTEFSLLHMRGRFAFSVSELSWIERKVAATLYSEPPKATIEEALRDFLAANEAKPAWIENLLYVAKCYIAIKETSYAISFLKEASTLPTKDINEEILLMEVKSLLKKHSK